MTNRHVTSKDTPTNPRKNKYLFLYKIFERKENKKKYYILNYVTYTQILDATV